MAFKILTKNGVENTNIDGARDYFFNSGMRDGIVKGALNEGTFGSNESNSIYFDTCELRISGHRVVIDEAVYKTFTTRPQQDTTYALIGQIIVDDSKNVEFSLFIQSASTPLIKDNLFKTTNGAGTYQIEIGRFTLTSDGTISDITRTAEIIIVGTDKEEAKYFRANIKAVSSQYVSQWGSVNLNLEERSVIDNSKGCITPYYNQETICSINESGTYLVYGICYIPNYEHLVGMSLIIDGNVSNSGGSFFSRNYGEIQSPRALWMGKLEKGSTIKLHTYCDVEGTISISQGNPRMFYIQRIGD